MARGRVLDFNFLGKTLTKIRLQVIHLFDLSLVFKCVALYDFERKKKQVLLLLNDMNGTTNVIVVMV